VREGALCGEGKRMQRGVRALARSGSGSGAGREFECESVSQARTQAMVRQRRMAVGGQAREGEGRWGRAILVAFLLPCARW
jgi:hypothetical protein